MKNEKIYKELKELIDSYNSLNTINQVLYDLFITISIDLNYEIYNELSDYLHNKMYKITKEYRLKLLEYLKEKYYILVPDDIKLIMNIKFLDKIIKEL